MYSTSLVSIVMPSLNQARFIELAVRSVFDQNYPFVELIIYDGGSNDGTIFILEKLKKEFGHQLIWHSAPDKGPAHAINKAFISAKGNIIGWLNSDDLYATDSIKHAVQLLMSSKKLIMVYGDGDHIDDNGIIIGHYPTLTPSKNLNEFQAGCYICQPTVFFKKEILINIGLLDESFATAFDFEFWLRIFNKYSNKIAYINRIQAHSRLHDNCITKRQRRLITVESMRVLHRYIGYAEPHWVLTHFEEICLSSSPCNLKSYMINLIQDVALYMTMPDLKWLYKRLEDDMRWRLSSENIFITVYTDGWCSRTTIIKFCNIHKLPKRIDLYCENAQPLSKNIELSVSNNWSSESLKYQYKERFFIIRVNMSNFIDIFEPYIEIDCDTIFIPKEHEYGSLDTRELSFKINEAKLVF